MKKGIKYILIFLSILTLTAVILILKPVPIVSESEAITERGIVSQIYANSDNDIFFVLQKNDRRFYINRGLERGIELNILKDQLIGNQIILKYPKYWTPLDWNGNIKHISKVEINNKVLFNELKR